MKEVKVNIPAEFTVEHFIEIGDLKGLTIMEKVIRVISSVSEYDEEFIKSWDIESLNKIYQQINKNFENVKPLFLPIFEWEGINYGLQPFSKMTAGEYIDLEQTIKKGNVLDTISILYRPVVKDRFDSLEWHWKSNMKYIKGEAENLFKYYTIEDYDIEKREWRKDIFKDLPMSVALGAYNFFLLVGIQLSNSILQSSEEVDEKMKKTMEKNMNQLLENTLDGSTHSTISQKREES
jgi:hypothetical protein